MIFFFLPVMNYRNFLYWHIEMLNFSIGWSTSSPHPQLFSSMNHRRRKSKLQPMGRVSKMFPFNMLIAKSNKVNPWNGNSPQANDILSYSIIWRAWFYNFNSLHIKFSIQHLGIYSFQIKICMFSDTRCIYECVYMHICFMV